MAVAFSIAPLLLAQPNVTATKTDVYTPNGAGKVLPGAPIQYRTVIDNTGSASALGVQLSDLIPTGTALLPNSVNVSPLAFDDAYTTIVNTQLAVGVPNTLSGPLVTNSVKVTDNDTEFLSDTYTISTYNLTSVQGGSVVMVTSGVNMGSFTYLPPAGFVGTDSFAYIIRDDGTDNTAGNADDLTCSGTVTITVAEANTVLTGTQKVWYVDNNYAGANGSENGTSTRPFDSLSDVSGSTGPDATTDTIFLSTGSGAYTGGITLLADQSLIGENQALILNSVTLKVAGTDPVLTNAAGSAVTLATGNTLQGFTIGDTTGGDIVGTAVGNLTVSNVICNGTGPIFTVTTSGALSVTLDTATTTSSTTTGINLTGCSGSFTGSSGAISGVSGNDFVVSSGTANISYAGTISNTAGRSVSIASKSGGTVTFSGLITDNSSSTGISLTSNTGATINFTGGITSSTTTNNAFTATGGGTVNVTGTSNTLTTSTGIALNVASTNIGPSGLTFRSISVNGATNGIVLNNTGGAGGLTVTGTGSSGTGGAIQNCSDHGISLTNTAMVELSCMNVINNLGSGISGGAINGLLLDRMTITGNGNDAATDESGINLTEVTGNAFNGSNPTGITNSTISNNNEFEVQITNNSGTLTDFRLTNNTISSNGLPINGNGSSPHGNLVNFLALGTANMTLNASGGNYTGNWNPASPPTTIVATGLQADHSGTSGTMTANITNATFTNLNVGPQASSSNGGSMIFDFNGNTVTGIRSHGINMFLSANASGLFSGKVRNNIVGTLNTAGSASSLGYGIRMQMESASTVNPVTLLISGNTVQETSNFSSLNIFQGIAGQSTTRSLNATITGNNFINSAARAIVVQQNNTTNITSAGTTHVSVSGNSFSGIAGQGGDGTEIRLRQLSANGGTFRVDQSDLNTLASVNSLTTADIAISGTITYNQGLPPQPLLFAANLPEPGDSVRPEIAHEITPQTPAPAEPQPAPAATATEEPLALTDENLQKIVKEAKSRWVASGLTRQQTNALESIRIQISDLSALHLGQASNSLIEINRNAAGNAWFIDPTPADDSEFTQATTSTRRTAPAGHPALDRIDLLTTLMHEMGHTLGLEDSYALTDRSSVMFGFLTKGERRLPAMNQAAKALIYPDDKTIRFLGTPITIGTLPPGKSVTIVGTVNVDDPASTFLISSQGTVSGSNFTDVLTDDTSVAGAANPTETPVERPDTTVTSLDRSGTNPSNASSVTWQVVFANAVNGLTSSNFSLANSGLGGTPAITGVTASGGAPATTWTITASTGTGSGTLGLNMVNDTSLTFDVTNQPFTGEVYAIDRTPPTATIVLADPALIIGETSLVTITYSEPVLGFTNADLTIASGSLSAVSSSDGGTTWTGTFTPSASVTDLTNVISLDNTGITDALGNAGTGSTNSANYTVDTARPTASIVVADSALRIGETSLVTITFTEAVSGFTNADLTIPNGSLTSVSSGDGGITWTATFTPTASVTDSTNVITLDNTGVTDTAGNAGSGSTDSNNYAIDTTRPTATIVVADTALRVGETSSVTITFSEAVSGFTSADLTVANGSVTSLSTSDGGVTWTATLTPTASFTDLTNVITLDNTGVTDAAGNAGSGSTDSNNYAIDTTQPTATIVVADTALRVGETSSVTFTFSEAVSGFTSADLAVANGSVTSLSTSDGGVTWTATLTPTANVTDTTNVITLDNTGVTDAAGNTGSGTTNSNNYAIDTARPTATIVVADDNLMIGETSLVTITFSEAVTGFTNADLTVDNGTLDSVSTSDGGTTWTATFTPTPNITDLTNLITLDNTGVTDAAGNTGSGTTDSNNYAITSLTVSIANLAAISEGNSGTTNFTFTITRAGGTTGSVSMTYTVSGAAVNAADFGGALPTNTVTIANGDTTTTVTIPVSGDTIVEPNEAFTVTLTAPDNGYVVSGAPATGIINNDDAATVSIAQVNHGAEANAPTAGKFRVTQTVASSVDTVLAYTVSGTATSGTDFTALSGSVTIPAGQTTADIDVTVLNDGTTLEPTETVVVILDGITTNNNVTLGSTLEATVNITDDDTATVTIAKIDDASEPSTNGLFRVTQSAGATVDTVLTYTVGGTATSGSDFTALSGSVTIAAGNTSADISLPVLDDAVVEATETAIVTLTNFTARDPDVSLGTTTAATVNIADNDTATVTIAKFSDGAESSTNGIFRVTQSAQSSTDTVVTYAVTGTATSGTDFTALSGSVTIPAGNTTADVTVLVLDETLVEGTETVIATLNGFTAGDTQVTLGATVAATVDITDNDSAIVTIAKMNDGAETASPTNALFRVTQSAASSTNTTLTYTIGGTATSGTDFTALSGSVTILAGNTTADISVAVLNETVVEATETVSLTLSAISTGDPEITLGATVSASADITDNDTANVTIAKIFDGAETPTNALFRVTQSAAATVDTVLTYTVGGTASGSDFTAPSGSVTILAGNTSADISVAITNDTIVEATETISLTATAFTARDPDVSIGSPQTATADIADNDNATLAIVKQDDGAESNSPTSGSFQITQTLASSTDTVINLGVSGTAASSSDYTALPATATIPAGQTSVTLPVTVLNDNMIESTETVITSLSSLASGNTSITIGAASVATVNITDNDIANSIAVNSGSGQSATVNTAFASPLVAVVRDAGGVALQGASVTFSAPSAGASGAFGASTTVTTNSNGLATAPAFTANTTSGSYTVSAATPGVTATASFSLTNNAGAATKYLVSAPANAIAGVPVDVTVTAQDAFNNTATAYAGTVRITSSDTAAILPANSTLTAGTRIFSVNFSTGGNQTVSATDSVISGINGTSGNVQVSPRADIAVTISDSPDPVNALGNLTYTIGVTNNGPSASADPVITLPLPASTTFVSTTAAAGWTPSTPTVGANGTVTFSTSTLASGASAMFTVVAKVDLNVVNNSTITATVSASQTTADPVTANNSAQTTTTARSGADLVATLSAAPEPVIAGTELTYTLRVKNNGPLDADNAALAFTLPVGTTFVSLGGNLGWTAMTPAVGASGTVTISNSLFANAADVSFPLVVKVGSNVVHGSVLNATVSASSSTIDVAPGNESASFAANVIARSDLALTVSGTPETAPKGSDVTYTITLTNNGPSDAVNPSVSFPLPAEMTYVSAAAPLGWVSTTPISDSTGTVNFANTGLGSGEIATFTVVAKVIPTTPTGTIITAGVATTATTADPDSADNSATFQIAVGTVNPTALQLTRSAVLNRQTGLFNVIVNVINTTPRPINGFRLRVDFATYIAAYPSLRLYNATSAAGSSDVFVEYPYPVAVDGVVPVSLSYYTNTRTFPDPFTPNYSVEILPSSAVSGTNGAGVQPRIVLLTDGNVLLEFPSVPGLWYRVRYSHDLTNWFDSPVPIQASNNRMQWIDSGAPLTVSPPSSVPSRYYRVNEIIAPPSP